MKKMKLFSAIFFLFITTLFCKENPWGVLSKPNPTATVPLAWTRYAIEGYALPTSIKPGETIKIYVSVCDSGTQHKNYTLKIFRVPDTANALYTSSVIAGRFYYLHDSVGGLIGIRDTLRRPVDFKNGCTKYWDSTAVSISNTSNWQSGLYYAQLEHQSSSVSQKKYYAPFVVRALNPGTTSKILFKYDFTTNQAYNFWGGGSLYSNSQDGSLIVSDTIAIDRPMWFALSQSIKFGYANDFIKTLEDSGMVMEYCNNIDIDSSGLGLSFLSAYKTLVLWQHDEYWSSDERNNTEKFMGRIQNVSSHGNLARFAQNTCYWRISWLNFAHLQLSCDKWWNSIAYSQTSRFRDIDSTNPEGKFLGSQYEHYYNDGETEMPSDSVITPSHWIFRGLGLNYGDTLGYGFNDGGRWYGLLGTELDNTTQTYGKSDYPTTILAKRYVRSHKDGGGTELVLHQMMYYEDTTTNARVYGLGSGALSNALYPYEGNDRWKIQQMVVNIMSHFSEKKYIGNVYTPISNPLEWSSNISLDGYVRILPNKKLLITGSPTVTIDSILLIDGELEINGNVTVAGAGSLNINPTGKLRLKENSTFTINPATFIMEAGSSIIYESGAKLVVKNATIKNNATLTVSSGGELDISSGGTLRFGSNSNVYSYGKVLATNATFTSLSGNSAGSWGNIVFDGNGVDYSNLNYCKIEKGGEVQCINGADVFVQNSVFRKMNRAVYFNNSAPWILGNDIDSMSLHAIEGTTNYQETSVYWNTIKRGYASQNYAGILFKSTGGNIIENKIEGFNVGMFFNGGSSPDFNQGNDNNPNPNNKITNNYTGVEVAYGSNPNMGDAEDYVNGNNSIYGNSYRNIYARNGSDVLAENNFFGCASPNNFSDGSSSISTESILTEDPFGEEDCQKMTAQIAEAQIVIPLPSVTRVTLLKEFAKGLKFKKEKNLTAATEHFKTMYASGQLATASLSQLATLYNDTVDYGVYDFLAGQKNVPSEHQNIILTMLAKLNNRRGDVAVSKQLFDEIISQYPNSNEAKDARFQKFYIALHQEKNKEAASQILKDLSDRYLGEEIASLKYLYETAVFDIPESEFNRSVLKKLPGQKQSQTALSHPLQFELFDNYPNPFNPTTTISYAIPEAGNVELKVYDYLGREIEVLVNSFKNVGKYDVAFDASKLSSGIYFYKIIFGRNVATKKMLLLK